MEQCRSCLIEARSGLDLDSYGVCSYCRLIDAFSNTITKIGKQESLLQQRLNMFRNTGEYDCIVGFSGGKDSSYVIYRLKSHYGIRVFAYTLDNGFLSEYAKKNIDFMVKEFDIEHIYVRPKDELLRSMYANNLASESWQCSACFMITEASAWKLAYEKRIPFIVNGRIPEQIMRRPTKDTFESFSSLIMDNLSPYDKNRVHKLAVDKLSLFENTKQWLLPDKKLWPLASEDIFLKSDYPIPNDFAPELLQFYLYEQHNESRIMDILERETRWIRPEKSGTLSHPDCTAHEAAGYLYYRMHGTSFLNSEVSALIRHNKLRIEEGKKILAKELENLSTYPQQSIHALSKVSGMHPFNIRLLPLRIKTKRFVKDKIKKLLKPKLSD